jgi:hypothetical protein
MLHRLNTIDYGSRRAGSSAADNTEKYFPHFFLDFLSIVGLPLDYILNSTLPCLGFLRR